MNKCLIPSLGVAVGAMLLAACGSSSTESGAGAGADDTLTIASWGGRFTETTQEFLATPFTEETGIEVQIVDVPGTQVAQLNAQRDAGEMQWDVMDSMGAAEAYLLAKDGLLAPLSSEQKAAYSAELGADKISDFGFSFASLGFVIACTDKVETCPSTMPEFFDAENFPGSRTLPGNAPSQLTSVLAEAMGVELPHDIDTLLDGLREIKPYVTVFYTSGDQQEQVIRQGEADMGIMYSGRAYSVQDSGTPLTINWAGTYDPGFTAQVADAPNPEAATKFMDWVVEHPEAQAKWAEQMQYSVPSPKALESLSQEVAERLADYPANFDGLGQQDFEWYVENKEAIDSGINKIVQGG